MSLDHVVNGSQISILHGNRPLNEKIKAVPCSKFKLTDLGQLTYFIIIEVLQQVDGIFSWANQISMVTIVKVQYAIAKTL